MGDKEEFKKGVRWVRDIRETFLSVSDIFKIADNIQFDYDLNVSVFETNIRVVGGLLAAHLLASDPDVIDFPEYKGELLNLTVDLARRLLPAFVTPTGIPFGTVIFLFSTFIELM